MEYVIGIDIGGTNTKLGAVSHNGEILQDLYFETTLASDYNSYLSLLENNIKSLMDSLPANSKCLGIGIGAPNGNYYSGSIEFAPNLPFINAPLVESLKAKFPLEHIYLTNDANVAALGEKIYGGAKDMKDFIVITLGTGLGSGVFVNNNLVYGADGFAGELGHICAVDNGRLCNCGKRGCLETYASATAVKRTFFEKLSEYCGKTSLSGYSWDTINPRIIEDAAKEGDLVAKETYEYTGHILGKSLADFVAFSRPEAIFLFGGIVKSGDLILKPTLESMNNNLLPIFKNKIKVLPSKLPASDAAILGAAALVEYR